MSASPAPMGLASPSGFSQSRDPERIRDRLIPMGAISHTPFALVENGSRPEQRAVAGALADLAERARWHSISAPALLVVGEMAALAAKLHWFGSEPLTAAGAASAAAPRGFAEAA